LGKASTSNSNSAYSDHARTEEQDCNLAEANPSHGTIYGNGGFRTHVPWVKIAHERLQCAYPGKGLLSALDGRKLALNNEALARRAVRALG